MSTFSWSAFWASVETFFSATGTTFLNSIKAAWPVLEQDLMNLLITIGQTIITDIATGVIPIPVLAAEPGATADPQALGNQKRSIAFTLIKQKLASTPGAPANIPDSQIYSAIEICYQIQKQNASGNGGNFPGGNSGPVVANG